MVQVISAETLINGLRNDFADTYSSVRIQQADGRLGSVMDLNVGATNRYHDFAYYEAAPHMELWARGETIPTDAMKAESFRVPVYTWGRRIAWHREDRMDDQTQSLMDVASQTGTSAALNAERMFFDLLEGTTNFLPAVPLAPDGAAFFANQAYSANRFGVANGNLLSGNGIASLSAIKTDYYAAMSQFGRFQDGKGQPLLSPEVIQSGAIILFNVQYLEVFEEAFLNRRQGVYFDSMGSKVAATGITAGFTPSNVILDASRNVQLWPTQRITGPDWYVILQNPPKKPTFLMDREGVIERTSIDGSAMDHTNTTNEEYIQWQSRQGAGIALPFGAIKINN